MKEVQFNGVTYPLVKGQVTMIASRPGSGKTQAMVSFANEVASQGNMVGYFSLEESREKVQNRLGGEVRFILDDTASMSVEELCNKAKMMVEQNEVKLIIVDYLHLLSGDYSLIDNLASELDIPVIVLSQASHFFDGISKRSNGDEGFHTTAPVENIFNGIRRRSKWHEKRKEDRQRLWWQSDDLNLDLTYTPFTITQVNGGYNSIAEFFNNDRLPDLKQEKAGVDPKNYDGNHFDIQDELTKISEKWALKKSDKNNCVSDEEWRNIVTLVKFSLSPRFIYATTYGNNIYIKCINPKSKESDINKNVLLGLYESHGYLDDKKSETGPKITLYATEIRDAAERYNLSFELMAAQVFLHELGHYVMDVDYDQEKASNKTAEESCANLIALLCMEQLVKNNHITEEEYNTIEQFMHEQPEEYQLGPTLMEENSWEWLKWMIFKGKYTGYIHKMENEKCILSVDGNEMYFKA